MSSRPSPSLIGRTIDNRYEVQRKLGEGGMGEVYLANQLRTGGQVALKTPFPVMLMDDPDLRERFIREFQVMSRLDHSNIMKVWDVVEYEGRPVAVLQYMAGGDLDGRRDLALEGWIPQIADALDYVHGKKLVHRDVKPGNIFFDSQVTPYLGDFGVVKALDGASTFFSMVGRRGTQTGLAMGTPKYMSPEQVEGHELDGRSDQYALAIIVYERLAGRIPFDAATPMHVFAAHLTSPPRRLCELNSRYGEATTEVLNRALAKRPEERFGSCREFGEAVLASLVPATVRSSGHESELESDIPGAAPAVRLWTELDVGDGSSGLGDVEILERSGDDGVVSPHSHDPERGTTTGHGDKTLDVGEISGSGERPIGALRAWGGLLRSYVGQVRETLANLPWVAFGTDLARASNWVGGAGDLVALQDPGQTRGGGAELTAPAKEFPHERMRILGWILFLFYIGLVVNLYAVFRNGEPVVVLAVLFASSALFILGAGRKDLYRPIRRSRLLMPVAAASFMLAILTSGLAEGFSELYLFDPFDAYDSAVGVWVAWGALATWIFWGVLLYAYTRNLQRLNAIMQLVKVVFAGSVAEMLATVLSHLIVSRRPSWHRIGDTESGILVALYVMIWSFGPAVLLVFLHAARRRDRMDTNRAGELIASHRPLQFSLRTILLVMVAMGVVSALLWAFWGRAPAAVVTAAITIVLLSGLLTASLRVLTSGLVLATVGVFCAFWGEWWMLMTLVLPTGVLGAVFAKVFFFGVEANGGRPEPGPETSAPKCGSTLTPRHDALQLGKVCDGAEPQATPATSAPERPRPLVTGRSKATAKPSPLAVAIIGAGALAWIAVVANLVRVLDQDDNVPSASSQGESPVADPTPAEADPTPVEADPTPAEFPTVAPPMEPGQPPPAIAPFDATAARGHQGAWLGQPVEFTNSTGMKLVLIPAGEFLMGSSESDSSAASDQKPQHQVRITAPFYLGVTEVTQQQYERVMGTNPSQFKGMLHPVDTMSWEDAVEFCRKLSEKEGRTYRLPTEAEWEYACRAGGEAKWSFGDDESELNEYAWYDDNSNNTTHPVGEKKPNAWGLFDMHGNVREWCSDWLGKYTATVLDDPMGTESGSSRVGRGGSWARSATLSRSAFRDGGAPNARGPILGFRVTSSSEPPADNIWEDASGTFRVEAEFLGLRGTDIYLKKTDGVTIKVPLARLTVECQLRVRKLATQHGVEP